jgi:hypothetical protein
MRKIEDYRNHATECRGKGKRARSTEERDMLLNMATPWESLAVNREVHISRLERMKVIETGPGGARGEDFAPDHFSAPNHTAANR